MLKVFELFEKVRIISKDLIGTIVDISETDGKTKYVVESDVKGKRLDGFGGIYPLFDCTEEDIEKVE